MEIKTVKINELKPHPKNPRVHPDSAIDKLVRSIKEYGWTNPVLVSADGYVFAGHARLKAAEKAGIEEVPVIYLPLEGAKAEAYLIADNRLQDETDWDYEKLKYLLQELDTGEFDIELTGFDVDEIEELIAQFAPEESEVEEDDFDPEENIPEIPVTQPGDLWILGRHRLLCGDATKKEDVERLMDGKKADMVFTDPPYGVNVKGGKGKGNIIAGDLTQTAIPFSFEICVKQATKDKARFYFCGGEGNIGLYFKLFERYLAQMPKLLIWVKNGFVIKQNGYHNQFELIFYGFKAGGGGKEYWYSGRTEDEASDVWRVSRDASTSYLHPTQKPIELPARAIRNSSKAGDTIFDPFGGSGSTLVACEQLNRTCYMMELDPIYCDVIIKRWENFTGQKAVLAE